MKGDNEIKKSYDIAFGTGGFNWFNWYINHLTNTFNCDLGEKELNILDKNIECLIERYYMIKGKMKK